MLIANQVGLIPELENAKIDGNVLRINLEEVGGKLSNTVRDLKERYELLLETLTGNITTLEAELTKVIIK